MSWKRLLRAHLKSFAAAIFFATAFAPAPAASNASSPAPGKTPLAPKIKVTDADNHSIVLNKPGMISVIVGTSEDSQDAARRAGKAMYPFQGKLDFQLVVVVDLRDSIAAWVPSVVIDHMRRSLDEEAVELKPYFLQNGNKANPRRSLHVVPDFKGTIVPVLAWSGTPDQLHAVMYGADGRELKRWENVDDMQKFQAEVHAALQALDAANRKAAASVKPPGAR
jgi:hypothetical protein